jgi:spermidine synthase
VLTHLPPTPARIGLVGLGAGTLATYGRTGDVYRIYEIDPQVFEIARSEFTFLADSRAALQDVVGDARLALERESPQRFDVLAIDAFSGGSIPIHLLTTQAIQVYMRHLQPGGVLAFHLTNRFLDLPPVLLLNARELGLHAVLAHDEAEDSDLRRTDWVLVSRDAARLAQPWIAEAAAPAHPIRGLRPWTDDFNDLLRVLK